MTAPVRWRLVVLGLFRFSNEGMRPMATTTTEPWTVVRSRLANAKKRDPHADVTDLQRDLKAARLADHVEKALADAPPLTDDQRRRIARLLIGGAP